MAITIKLFHLLEGLVFAWIRKALDLLDVHVHNLLQSI